MKLKLVLTALTLFCIGLEVKAQYGCFQNEFDRIYTVRKGTYNKNGTLWPKYSRNTSYSTVVADCPKAILLVQRTKGVCYVGSNRGAEWTYRLVTDCDLDNNAWLLLIPTGLVGFAVVRNKLR